MSYTYLESELKDVDLYSEASEELPVLPETEMPLVVLWMVTVDGIEELLVEIEESEITTDILLTAHVPGR